MVWPQVGMIHLPVVGFVDAKNHPNLTLSAPCVPQAGTVGIGFDRVISTNGVATAVDGRRWPQRLQNRASAM